MEQVIRPTDRVLLFPASQHGLLSNERELLLGHGHDGHRHVFFVLLFFPLPPSGCQLLLRQTPLALNRIMHGLVHYHKLA